jgi:hypothetical protein
MAKTTRPIRIIIPEEMKLTANEIISLEHTFKSQLQIVEKPGDVPLISSPINTAKLPVEVEMSTPVRRGIPRNTAKKSAKKKGKAKK